MADGSTEADELNAITAAIQAEADAALEGLDLVSEDPVVDDAEGGQADTTEATDTKPDEAKQATSDAEGDDADGTEGGEKPGSDSGPDLTHLPGHVREALQGQPAEVVESIDKAYRGMVGDYTRDKQALKSEREEFAELQRYGETLRDLLQVDAANDLVQQAVREYRADRGIGDAATEENGDLAGILDAPDDATMEQRLDAAINRRVEAKLRQKIDEPQERGDAIIAAGQKVCTEMKVTDNAIAQAAWLKMLDDVGEDNITPENVALHFGPRLQVAVLTAGTTKPAGQQRAKPGGAKGRKTAGVPLDSNLSTAPVPRYVREGRKPTEDELMYEALKEAGVTLDEFERGMRTG